MLCTFSIIPLICYFSAVCIGAVILSMCYICISTNSFYHHLHLYKQHIHFSFGPVNFICQVMAYNVII